MVRPRYRLVVPAFVLGAISFMAAPASAQDDDDLARRHWRTARMLAVQGRADSALAHYAEARRHAEKDGDQSMVAATLVGAAQVHAVHIGCNDSATILFREALRRSGPGDRLAADAFVRYLAATGKVAEAQQVLADAYQGVEGLGRAITRESMTWYQGTAAIQRARGQEPAALATLNSALEIAARLRTGDVSDSVAKPTGEVDPVNYWVMYDLAQLRLNARSRSVANTDAGTKIMDALVNAGAGFDERDELPIPVSRLLDTLTLQAHQCAMQGGRNCNKPALATCRNR